VATFFAPQLGLRSWVLDQGMMLRIVGIGGFAAMWSLAGACSTNPAEVAPTDARSAAGPMDVVSGDLGRGRDAGDAVDVTTADVGRDGGPPRDGSASGDPPCVRPGGHGECILAEFPNRPYRLWVPPQAEDGLVPVVLAFHGGGGNPESGAENTCPGGDPSEAGCLHEVGFRRGFATVYPSGTVSALGPKRRIWNAGGGRNGWACVGFCDPSIDEAAYIGAILDELAVDSKVDLTRVYATGLSNGAAVVHRLGCELADRITAIAPIGGGNQFATSAACTPSRPMPILYVHGTADGCWPYEGGPIACSSNMNEDPVVSVDRSMRVWADRNGCDGETVMRPGPERVDDGIEVSELRWLGCEAPTRHFRVRGGGHTWLNGAQYLPVSRIGPRFPDVTSEDLWSFFEDLRL
jgi:polyhydroxybutyrate depolymerase